MLGVDSNDQFGLLKPHSVLVVSRLRTPRWAFYLTSLSGWLTQNLLGILMHSQSSELWLDALIALSTSILSGGKGTLRRACPLI